MQDALLALTKYWTDRGCMIVQPFNTEVGAGTYNPATILRVLGPEPWRVSYVEPSVRPDDARYGENPNRLQTHTQFQVILKPDPGDPQEVYLGSLEALGIDIHAHDIRFVEDNWASPALGAWGLGWEVWLDGMEITQFTYFQQAGGKNLDPVSVEITYGIERILMALQNVSHFKDIAYAPGISYGEAFGQAEYEMSRYYLDDADVEANRRLFDEYASEAQRCVDERLPVPAHTYVLKCSHAFNVLDSRGAISTTERAAAFATMRKLARQVSELWDERRKELNYPLGVVEPPPDATLPAEFPDIESPSTLLFEVGTEELPHAEVRRQSEAVKQALTAKLAETRLVHGDIDVYSTPRRLIAIVEAVQPREPDAERTVRGPRVQAAFDADGQPTKAAQGFARGQGIDPADLTRIEQGGVEYVAAVRTDEGRKATGVLSQVLGSLVAELRADKNMRWNDPKLDFTRPIRWLVALLGETPVPVAVSTLQASATTRVRRTAAQPKVTVAKADGYLDFLKGHDILADADERRALIVERAVELAAGVGGRIDVDGEAALLDEITNLVERPEPVLGGFEQRYLELPADVLMTVMRKHQRYLPVRAQDGTLLPHFVAVADGECDHDVVRNGYEAVLRARYEDAAFFWRADLSVPPVELKRNLVNLAFERTLGSVADRAHRIAGVAEHLAGKANLAPEEQATLHRAGELAKFDLASQMVVELTSLAGVMAREYASHAGETPAVAQALYDMELPRGAGGRLPESTPGALLALADRFDLLAGLFAVGANPTGSSDPFALRRAALGVVSILRGRPELEHITVRTGLAAAAERIRAQGVEVPDTALEQAAEFVIGRYEQQLLDAGYEHTFVRAVLPLADAPAVADGTLLELGRRAGDQSFADLTAALQRVRRIVPDDQPAEFEPEALSDAEEIALMQVLEKVRAGLGTSFRLAEFADGAQELVAPINTFFDAVLVMAEDPAVRAARLGLLASIRDLAAPVLDWQELGTF
ncbi:glycine--tRNA ligase [Flindersiella endophytica]